MGAIQRLGKNHYRVSIEGRPTPEGKRTRRSKVVRGTRSEAEAVLARMKLDEGLRAEESTWQAFWESKVEPQIGTLSPKTAHEYRRLWKVELAPRISGEQVRDMDWARANEVLTSVKAPTVQRSAGRLLKKMCNMAVRCGLLASCPVDRAIEYAPHRKRAKRLVTADGLQRFMESIRGLKYEPIILLELGAGLRPEEARALLWEDVSAFAFKGSTYCSVTVDKALTMRDGNAAILKSTKNAPSEREAVCGEPFASRVLELSEGKSGPLCPSGAPYDEEHPEAWYTSPVTIAHNWKQWCARNGVEHVTDENMRSSYATMMGEAMVPDSVVAGNMGHSDGTTKGEHYQRVTMRAKCMAADMLAESLSDFLSNTM